VGLSGVGERSPHLPLTNPACGAFGYERRARYPDDFKDGVSSTILLIETSANLGPWIAAGTPTMRYVDSEVQQPVGVGGPFGRSHFGSFLGYAEPCANVGMADGSAHVLSASLSLETLRAAATIAGNDFLGDDW
jgi:hypothetical protein